MVFLESAKLVVVAWIYLESVPAAVCLVFFCAFVHCVSFLTFMFVYKRVAAVSVTVVSLLAQFDNLTIDVLAEASVFAIVRAHPAIAGISPVVVNHVVDNLSVDVIYQVFCFRYFGKALRQGVVTVAASC